MGYYDGDEESGSITKEGCIGCVVITLLIVSMLTAILVFSVLKI